MKCREIPPRHFFHFLFILQLLSRYNFNKTHSAVKGTQIANIRFYLSMLQQEARWANLILRLQASDEKIRLIREGKLEVRVEPDREEKKRASRKTAERDENPAVKAALPAALPMDKELLRAAAGSDVRIAKAAKAAEKNEEGESKTPAFSEAEAVIPEEAGEKTEKKESSFPEIGEMTRKETGEKAETETAKATGPEETVRKAEPAQVPSSQSETSTDTKTGEEISKTGEVLPSETELPADPGSGSAETGIVMQRPLTREEQNIKWLLLDAAVRTGDRSLWETAAQAPGPELFGLWAGFLEEDEKRGYPYLRELETRTGRDRPPEEDCLYEDEWDEEYEYV